MTVHFEKNSLAKWVTILTALILSASMALSILPTDVYAQAFDESDSPQTTEPAGQRSQVRLDEKLTDPTTVLQASPDRAGDVLTSKNVRQSSEGFNIELSALSSAERISTQLEEPMDIVLVLDTSGTMTVNFGQDSSGQNMTRMQAMQKAVNEFIDEVQASNQEASEASEQSQIGIITFGDEADLNLPLTSDLNQARKVIDGLKPFGVTYTDKAFIKARELLQSTPSTDNRRKVVIFFSDGVPSNGYGFTRSIADSAVENAYQIKSGYQGTVYSIGIFGTADPDASILLPEDSRKDNENRFMQALSSNFPDAKNYSTKGDLGLRYSYRYYMSAQDPSALLNVFETIFESMTMESGYPIETNPDAPSLSGYTTMTDQMGDWMEVCSNPLLNYQGRQYEPVYIQQKGNTTTYRYSGFVEGNVLTGQKIYDLAVTVEVDISTHPGRQGDEVLFRFPAALLPMTYYRKNGQEDVETIPALPISLQYKTRIKPAMANTLNGLDLDANALQWIQEHQENDQVRFYANVFQKQGKNDFESGATAIFRPASEPIPASETPTAENDNTWSDYQLEKEDNVTDSASFRQKGTIENGLREIQYGNNGVMVYGVNTDLEVYKFVQADRTLTIPDQDFRFLITLNDANGQPWTGTLEAEKLTEQSPDTYIAMDPVEIVNGQGSFILKNREKIRIHALPLYASLHVEEDTSQSMPGFTSISPAVDTTVLPQGMEPIAFINTYQPEPLILSALQTGFSGVKNLSGREWQESDVFQFRIDAESPIDAPLPSPNTVNVTSQSSNHAFAFGSVAFEKPGIYSYYVSESRTGQYDLPGIKESMEVYRVTLEITQNPTDGKLTASKPVIVCLRDQDGNKTENPPVDQISFTNTYSVGNAVYTPILTKTLEGDVDGLPEAMQTFWFEMSTTDPNAPMPDGDFQTDGNTRTLIVNNAGTLISFGPISFTSENADHTYEYTFKEVAGSIEGMTYSSTVYHLSLTVTKRSVKDEVVLEVIPTWSVEDENREEETENSDNTQADQRALLPLPAEESPVFENTYFYQPADVKLQGEVYFNDQLVKTPELFTFSMTWADESTKAAYEQGIIQSNPSVKPENEILQTLPNTDAGTFQFDTLTFSRPGNYFFKITENDPYNLAGYGAKVDHSREYAVVQVTTPENPAISSKLEASVYYINAKNPQTTIDRAQFYNYYKAVFDPDEALTIPAIKHFQHKNGSPLTEAEKNLSFTFELTSLDTQGESVYRFFKPEGEQFNVLDGVTYNAPGTYTYQLQESPQLGGYPAGNIDFDSSVYTITVKVGTKPAKKPTDPDNPAAEADPINPEEQTGLLYIESVTILKDGNKIDWDKDKEELDPLVFSNSCKRTPVTAPAFTPAKKILRNDTLSEGQFTFQYTVNSEQIDGWAVNLNDDLTIDEQGNITVTNKADGTIPPLSLTFTQPGTYTVTLEEIGEENDEFYYDQSVLSWTYVVTEENGQLSYTLTQPP